MCICIYICIYIWLYIYDYIYNYIYIWFGINSHQTNPNYNMMPPCAGSIIFFRLFDHFFLKSQVVDTRRCHFWRTPRCQLSMASDSFSSPASGHFPRRLSRSTASGSKSWGHLGAADVVQPYGGFLKWRYPTYPTSKLDHFSRNPWFWGSPILRGSWCHLQQNQISALLPNEWHQCGQHPNHTATTCKITE